MSKTDNSLAQDPRARDGAPEESENALRPVRRRSKAPSAAAEAGSPVGGTPDRGKAPPVPQEIQARFVRVKNAYFFPDGAKAFTDRGDRLTTPSENREVIRSLVAIAETRGWGEVVVTGTERFRREAWIAARASGLEVRGYKPSKFEQERLERSQASTAEELGPRSSAPTRGETRRRRQPTEEAERTPTNGALLRGKLIEHGRAPYLHDPQEPWSYFVKLETSRGERTIWGVDLERALKQSLSQPEIGDRVGLRSLGQEAVKVKSPRRDEAGAVIGQREIAAHRNRWKVETESFLEGRAQAARTLRDTSIDSRRGAKQHPELAGTYLQVRAAELAAKQIRDPQDQKRFVEKVREALAISVARGEPLPPVRLREGRAPESRSNPARSAELAPAR